MTGFQSKKASAADKLFDRYALAEQLEDQDFEYIMNQDGGLEMLRSILAYGFKGYTNYTDEELIAEQNERMALNGRDEG